MPFSDFFLRQRLLNQGVNPYSGAGGPSTPGQPAPGLLGRLSAAAFPASDASGLTTPEQQRAAQQQGLLSFGTSLLANSGSQPGPRRGIGSLIGQALQDGQGASQGGINSQLQQMLLAAKIKEAQNGGQDPAKVREYQFAQKNGFKGSYQDFLQLGQGGIGNFNPGQYTPESLEDYLASRTPENPIGDVSLLQRYVAPAAPVVTDVAGVKTVVQPTRGGGPVQQQPLTTLPATVDAGRQIKEGEAVGAATGKATGEALGGIQKKGIEAGNVLGMLDQAEGLIDISTGSGAGAAVDSVAGFFGFAPDGAQAAASLKVLQSNLVLGLPRLEGPQSDRDTALYKEAAAQIGDPSIPAATKKAALKTVREIQERYRDQFQAGGAKPAKPNVNSLVEKYRTKK